MSEALQLVEQQIEEAKESEDIDRLQMLYLRRERLQEKQFKDSLRRRAKLNKDRP